MEYFNLLIEVSSSSILLFAGIYYLTNKKNKNIGLNLLGGFLLMLGVHYALIVVTKLWNNAFAELIEDIKLLTFFLSAYVPLLYLITYHYKRNLDKIEKRTLLGFLILIVPLIRLILEGVYQTNLKWLTNTSSFIGSLLITVYNLFEVRKSNLNKIDRRLLIHINSSFFLMIAIWLMVLFARNYLSNGADYLTALFLFTQLYLVYGLVYYSLNNPSAFLKEQYLIQAAQLGDAEFSNKYKYPRVELNTEEVHKISHKILQALESDMLFLNPDLTLEMLAARLGLAPQVVSQAIKSKFNTNFSGFISEYRQKNIEQTQLLGSDQHPFFNNGFRKGKIIPTFLVLTFVFNLLQPLIIGLTTFDIRFNLILTGYGGIATLILYLHEFWLKPKISAKLKEVKNQPFMMTVWYAWVVLVICVVNYGLALLLNLYATNVIAGYSFSYQGFFGTLLKTLAVVVFPIIYIYLEAKRLIKDYQLATLLTTQDTSQVINLSEIVIKSENQKDWIKLEIDDLLFLKSSDNYVAVIYLDNSGDVKKKLIRNTLKNIEQQALHSLLVRCHQSYIINLGKVTEVVKKRGTSFFMIHSVEDLIPISKSKQKEVLSKMSTVLA